MKRPELVNFTPPIIAGRVPVHDLEAEGIVVGSILLDGQKALDRVMAILRPEHFYADANGRIYEAALELSRVGTPLDMGTIASWLRDRERLQGVGGMEYLQKLIGETLAAFHLEAHAKTVLMKWKIRQRVGQCQEIAAEGYGDVGDPQEWLDRGEERVAAAGGAEDAEDDGGCSMRDAVVDLWSVWDGKTKEIALSTGLPDLDRMLGGMKPGQLITIAAWSGHGKSALGAQIADHVGTKETAEGQRCGVAVFTLEMKRRLYTARMVTARSGVNNAKLSDLLDESKQALARSPNAEEWERMQEASKALVNAPIRLYDSAGIRPAQIRAKCRALAARWKKAKTPLRLVVIDYVQIVRADDEGRRHDSREREVASIGRAAKELAFDLDVTVVLLAQLNKDGIKANRPPLASDLRESAALEQDSDAVILIYNEERAKKNDVYLNGVDVATMNEGERADLIAGKGARIGGAKGRVRVNFRPSCTRFESWAGDAADLAEASEQRSGPPPRRGQRAQA